MRIPSRIILAAVVYFLLLVDITNGQIVLNNNNYPVGGLYINRGYCYSAPGVLGNPGGNQYYDFTNIVPLYHDTIEYWDAAQTPWLGFHPGTTVANGVMKGPITAISFYTSSTGAFCRTGLTYIGNFGLGLDTAHANLVSPDTILADDFTYGYNGTQTSKATFVNFLPFTNYQTITHRSITIDGWGSLETPLNYYNDVLRAKSVEYLFDTAFYLGSPVYTSADTMYNILFYAKDVRHPVIVAYTDSAYNLFYFEYIYSPPVIVGCMDSTAVNYNPLANQPDTNCVYCSISFSITHDTTICPGASVQLIVSGGGTYLWNTGDTLNSINVSPTQTTTYSVYISDSSGCHVLASTKVEVDEPVLASFWTIHNTYYAGDSVQFINISDNATYFNWDFDEPPGGYSNLEFPKYAYSTTGVKNVILHAGNSCFEDSTDSFINILAPSFVYTQDASEKFKVYPNPGTDFLNIEGVVEEESDIEISICDLVGRVIFQSLSENSIGRFTFKTNVAEIPAGLYMLVINTKGSTTVLRWMKAR